MSKRLVTIILVLIMLFALSVPALAANGNGELSAEIVQTQDGYNLDVTYVSGNNSIKAAVFEVLSPDGSTTLLESPVVPFSNKTGKYSFKIAEDIPAKAVIRMTEDKGNKPVVVTSVFAEGFVVPLGTVEVTGGLVSGVDTHTEGVTIFKGIPYAAPPVGELRWKAPQPVVP